MSEWRNAAEVLPEKDECVLAVAWGKIGENFELRGGYIFAAHDDEGWYSEEINTESLEIDRVTWWQPLPEPPSAADEKAAAALAALNRLAHGEDPCAVCVHLHEEERCGVDAECIACWNDGCPCCACIKSGGYSRFEWDGGTSDEADVPDGLGEETGGAV